MNHSVATALFQNKSCTLPGVGKLILSVEPAEKDFINSQIKAPTTSIKFIEDKKSKIHNEFSSQSELIKKKLDEDRLFDLEGVGTFSLSNTGHILFDAVPLTGTYFQSVPALRVVRENAEHALLVGDRETTNTGMNEFYTEETAHKKTWWIWALIMGLAGITTAGVYYYQNGNNHSFGNRHKIQPLTMDSLYRKIQ